MMQMTGKDQYAQMICLYLAESLRTKRCSIKRAGEIAQKILDHVNLIDTEAHFLSLIKEMSKDFEELLPLESILKKDQQILERRHVEDMVRQFSIANLGSNSQDALSILEDAASQMSLDALKSKYPNFKKYVESTAN